MFNEASLRLLKVVGVWFGALATLAAVVLALFLQLIQEPPDRFGTTIYLTLPEAGDGQSQP